jgi:hypothetical protein
MIDAGYSIRTDSGSQLVFGKFGEPSFGGIGAEWGYVIGYSLIETPPTVRVVAEPRAVLHYGKINETEYTMAPQYGQNASAQADAVLAALKHKFSLCAAVVSRSSLWLTQAACDVAHRVYRRVGKIDP